MYSQKERKKKVTTIYDLASQRNHLEISKHMTLFPKRSGAFDVRV